MGHARNVRTGHAFDLRLFAGDLHGQDFLRGSGLAADKKFENVTGNRSNRQRHGDGEPVVLFIPFANMEGHAAQGGGR